jgi:hypothetical protein
MSGPPSHNVNQDSANPVQTKESLSFKSRFLLRRLKSFAFDKIEDVASFKSDTMSLITKAYVSVRLDAEYICCIA